jgi:hypothetical protein
VEKHEPFLDLMKTRAKEEKSDLFLLLHPTLQYSIALSEP